MDEVAFLCGETLFDMACDRQIVIPKGTLTLFDFSKGRTYRSYCLEFCGQNEIGIDKLRFECHKKEVEQERCVFDSCEITVFQLKVEAVVHGVPRDLCLLYRQELRADIRLLFKSKVFRAHKGILMARSEKFRAMFSSPLTKSKVSEVEIKADCSINTFECMLYWIYGGNCILPEDVFEVLSLLALADEYFLYDLLPVCEEDIMNKIDPSNVVRIITHDRVIIPEPSDSRIFLECKNVLLAHFSTIYAKDSEVEAKLVAVPGLITQILLHANDSGILMHKSLKELHRTTKKKVRFNLAQISTIPTETHSLLDIMDHTLSAPGSETHSLHSLNNNIDSDEEFEDVP